MFYFLSHFVNISPRITGNIGPCRGLNCSQIMRRLVAFTQVNNYQEITFLEYLISCQKLVDIADNFLVLLQQEKTKVITISLPTTCGLNVN